MHVQLTKHAFPNRANAKVAGWHSELFFSLLCTCKWAKGALTSHQMGCSYRCCWNCIYRCVSVICSSVFLHSLLCIFKNYRQQRVTPPNIPWAYTSRHPPPVQPTHAYQTISQKIFYQRHLSYGGCPQGHFAPRPQVGCSWNLLTLYF